MVLKELFRCYVTEESFEQYKHLDGATCDIKLNAKEQEDTNGHKCFVECSGEGVTYEFTDAMVVTCDGCCELRFFNVVHD